MNTDKINQWLGLIANVGVLAGIVFLAIEIQQNSAIAQADSYREIVQDIAEWRSELNADAELFALFRSYASGGLESMNDGDQLRMIFVENNILGSYESAFYSRKYGIISDNEWSRFEYGACNHYNMAIRNERVLTLITQEFNDFLGRVCAGTNRFLE